MFQPSERIALAALDRPASIRDWLRVVDGIHNEAGFWWLDSALCDDRLGRHSFAGSDPYLWLRVRGSSVEVEVLREVRPGLSPGLRRSESDPLEWARSLLPRADSIAYSARNIDDRGSSRWHESAGLSAGLELPFLGGAVGYIGYELAATLEPRIVTQPHDDLGLPDLALAFVDRVLAYDHRAERLWVLGLGFGEVGAAEGSAIERSRLLVDGVVARIEQLLGRPDPPPRPAPALPRRRVATPIESTTDASGYAKAVDAILQEIGEGNVYQANFSQRLSLDASVDPWHLYLALRRHNPAPFGAYLQIGEAAVLSSSPERFLRMDEGRRVESRPIKGTRPRGDTEIEDERLRDALSVSEKDRAENLMIVDLVRNDLGRVCTPGSIEVPELMAIETYAAVFQMVSTVTGLLATHRDAFDLLRATFPPGSMTGAPKLAAIDLLSRLESIRRGVYAGALGYLDVRGGLDLSVVIRTLVWKEGRAHLHVGGGVVADSSAEGEYFESLDKAKAPLAAIAETIGADRG